MIPVVAIMPTANRRAFVPAAIACFLSQTYSEKRLLVLDNGSDPVADLIPADERIVYVKAVPGVTAGTTGHMRNILCGMAADTAEDLIVAHWDDDDWSAPERIAHQVARIEEAGKPVTGFKSLLFWPGFRHVGMAAPYVFGTTLCYRLSWWNGHRFPDRRTGEDHVFVRQAAGSLGAA